MNWFHRIMLVLLAFIAMMVYFAVRSINTPLDLVTDKYYEAELTYQDRINQITNDKNLEEPVTVKVVNQKLSILFPAGLSGVGVKGKIKMYCPASKARDKEFEIALQNGNEQQIDVSGLSGAYSVQIDWTYSDQSYYTEHKLFL